MRLQNLQCAVVRTLETFPIDVTFFGKSVGYSLAITVSDSSLPRSHMRHDDSVLQWWDGFDEKQL